MTVSKEKKSEYNRSAYLKRKAKKQPADQIKELFTEEDDNVADIPDPPVAQRQQPEVVPEYDEIEISQDDYKKFLQWRNCQANVEETKKKLDSDPSYLLSVLKTLGVALAPALIGAFQRALVKTLEQKQEQTTDPISLQNGIPLSAPIGLGHVDPLGIRPF